MSTLFKRGLSSRLRKDIGVLTLGTSIALGVALSATLASPIPPHPTPGPTVQTTEGPVQGFRTKGVTEFLGIPYAAPPVGDLRWRPPVSHAHWTKVLQATAFGSNCPQNNENGAYAGPVNTTNESCLFLNVFTPDLGNSHVKLPVMFWIHGGGNMDGESTDYDGSKLAAQGHTVVVTINFRLGSLGWLAVPALDAEGHLFGNYGLLDQQFALKWVQQNIAKFGGDPNNVTVGGQSFGSEDTEANMVSPLAKGLFHRAIFESEITEPQNLATAEAGGTTLANDANCNAANGDTTNAQIAACLRALTVEQILGPASGEGLPVHNSLIGDGTILPLQPATVSPTQPGAFYLAFRSGNYNHMPVMSGTVEDEENFFLATAEYVSQTPYSAAQYAAAIAAYPTTSNSYTAPLTIQQYVAAHYPLISSTPPGPQLSIDPLLTDRIACPQHNIDRLIATGPSPSPVYTYEFDDRTAPFYFPPFSFPFESLAYHTGDIQYLFPLFHGGPAPPAVIHALNPKQEILSDQLVAAWTNLAWTGNPNGTGNFPWPRYQGSKPNSYYLLENIAPTGLTRQTDAQFAARHNCDFWDTYLTP